MRQCSVPTWKKAHQNKMGGDLAFLLHKSGVSSNRVTRATNSVPRTETALKQGYILCLRTRVFSRASSAISVMRLSVLTAAMSTASSVAFPTHVTFPSSVAAAEDCKSEGSQCVSFTSDDRFQWWAT